MKATKIWLILCFGLVISCYGVRPPPPDPNRRSQLPADPVLKSAAELLSEADYLALVKVYAVDEVGNDFTLTAAGFLWKPENKYYVASAAHIVPRAGKISRIAVKFNNDREKEHRASILKYERSHDACLLTIDDPNFAFAGRTAKFGDSHKIKIGNTVFALGHPRNRFWNITEGKVRATNYRLSHKDLTVALVMHSAWGWYGSSGGPLINRDGEVLGMNIMFVPIDKDNLEIYAVFAVPSNTLKNKFNEWLKNPH